MIHLFFKSIREKRRPKNFINMKLSYTHIYKAQTKLPVAAVKTLLPPPLGPGFPLAHLSELSFTLIVGGLIYLVRIGISPCRIAKLSPNPLSQISSWGFLFQKNKMITKRGFNILRNVFQNIPNVGAMTIISTSIC